MTSAGLVLWLAVCPTWGVGEAAGPPARTDRYGDPLPPGALARLGTIRLRHAAAVRCVAFTPDGKAVVSADADWVQRWDAATGKRLGSFRSPATRLGAAVTEPLLVLSADGRLLATVARGDDRSDTVVLRETTDGKVRANLKGLRMLTQLSSGCLAFSPDGKSLLTGTQEGKLQLWDRASGKELRVIRGEFGACTSLAFAPDGRTLVAAHGDGTVLFWDVADRAGGKAP